MTDATKMEESQKELLNTLQKQETMRLMIKYANYNNYKSAATNRIGSI